MYSICNPISCNHWKPSAASAPFLKDLGYAPPQLDGLDFNALGPGAEKCGEISGHRICSRVLCMDSMGMHCICCYILAWGHVSYFFKCSSDKYLVHVQASNVGITLISSMQLILNGLAVVVWCCLICRAHKQEVDSSNKDCRDGTWLNVPNQTDKDKVCYSIIHSWVLKCKRYSKGIPLFARHNSNIFQPQSDIAYLTFQGPLL